MENFFQYYYSLQESLRVPETNFGKLTPKITFSQIKNWKNVKAYRSSARADKPSYVSGTHVGTLQQALIRADYFLNDEETHKEYYLYELEIALGKVYPQLESDNGENHGNDYYKNIFKEYDTVIYKNTGEGNINDPNLSLVILNPSNIISSKRIKTLTPEYLQTNQKYLYS
jgi:hypothetical protein